MTKLGFSLQSSYSRPMPQVIDLLADAGFSAVSPGCELNDALESVILQAKQRNLTLQSLHGPVRGMPAMWSRDRQIAEPITREILQSATDCARFGIPILVVHPWNGVDYTFCREALCFDGFDALVTLGERLSIRIAFENLEGPEYLAALMERYESSKAVGFCWDSGHELCYGPGCDFLRLYGDRLIMTHLNDNLGVTDPSGRLDGTDDLHLLPYHGILDWEKSLLRLQSARKQEILNFELKIRPKGNRCKLDLYSQIPLEQYFAEAYRQASLAVAGYFEA